MKISLHALFTHVKYVFTHTHFLFFIHGFFAALIIYSYAEDQYENELFDSLKPYVYSQAKKMPSSGDAVLLASMHFVHQLENRQQNIFAAGTTGGFMINYLRPASYDLLTVHGACGSYSYTLGRLLQSMGYPVRFVLMKVGDTEAGHIILEAKNGGKWIVLDAMYDLSFKTPDGQLAGFAEVNKNWPYYKRQVPRGYNPLYQYEDAAYSNWNKIPVLMPAMKKVLDWTIGKKKADLISLRTLFLRKFHLLLLSLLLLYSLVVCIQVNRFIRKRMNPISVYLNNLNISSPIA